MLTLYQAEWCPFSSAVREILTELGLDFVARHVEPWPEQRAALRTLAGSDQIPTLQTEDGRFLVGTRAIYGYLRELEPGAHAEAHRRRFLDHRDARESDAAGQLVEYFRLEPSEPVTASPDEAIVVDVPEASRYELRLGDRVIGVAAYHRRNGRIAFIHTEIDEACEGRGFGSRRRPGRSTTLAARASRWRRSAPSSPTTSTATPSTLTSSRRATASVRLPQNNDFGGPDGRRTDPRQHRAARCRGA